jgi:hypothetical protein
MKCNSFANLFPYSLEIEYAFKAASFITNIYKKKYIIKKIFLLINHFYKIMIISFKICYNEMKVITSYLYLTDYSF